MLDSLVIRSYFLDLDIEIRGFQKSKDENFAYIHTYEGVFLWVNMRDPSNLIIETTLEISTSSFSIYQDMKYALKLKNSRYTLYDISQVFMDIDLIAPTFMQKHRPIVLNRIEFSEADPTN